MPIVRYFHILAAKRKLEARKELIGSRIRRYRRWRNLSQRQFALLMNNLSGGKLNVSRVMVTQWESGFYIPNNNDYMPVLCLLFKITEKDYKYKIRRQKRLVKRYGKEYVTTMMKEVLKGWTKTRRYHKKNEKPRRSNGKTKRTGRLRKTQR